MSADYARSSRTLSRLQGKERIGTRNQGVDLLGAPAVGRQCPVPRPTQCGRDRQQGRLLRRVRRRDIDAERDAEAGGADSMVMRSGVSTTRAMISCTSARILLAGIEAGSV